MKRNVNYRVGRVEGGGAPQQQPSIPGNLTKVRNSVNKMVFEDGGFEIANKQNEKLGKGTEKLENREVAPTTKRLG